MSLNCIRKNYCFTYSMFLTPTFNVNNIYAINWDIEAFNKSKQHHVMEYRS